MMPSFPSPKPGHLFLPGCAIAAGLLAVTLPASADSTAKPAIAAPVGALANGAQELRIGQTLTFPLSATVTVEDGAEHVLCTTESESLSIKALQTGPVKIRVAVEGQEPILLALNIKPKKLVAKNLNKYVMRRDSAQIVERAATPGAVPTPAPLPDFLQNIPAPTGSTTQATPSVPDSTIPLTPATPTAPDTTTPAAPTTSTTTDTTAPVIDATGPVTAPATDATSGLPPLAPFTTTPSDTATTPATDLPPTVTAPGTLPPADYPPAVFPPSTPPPAVNPPAFAPQVAPTVATPQSTAPRVAPPVRRSSSVTSAGGAQISPNLPAPTRNAKVAYRTTPRIPAGVKTNGSRSNIQVTQGLARVLAFPSNILSVFFSDPTVMDARAINARNIAVTGVGTGESTLAVFTSTGPGDVLGKANIYRIQTSGRANAPVNVRAGDPEDVQAAIQSALGDPRIRVTVQRIPDGTLSARLIGTVRNIAEVEGAVTTAGLYVPKVLSSLYADPTSPTIDQVLSTAPAPISAQGELQENLRRITGNSSIDLVSLPTGLGLKAEVNSPEEAEALLRVVPSLNQPVIPFIVVRGAASSDNPYYNSNIPVLQGEDLQLTQKLQAVTGIRTVYATRTAGNSVAIYGNVRSKGEYERVRRYGFVIAQQSNPIAVAGTTQGGQVLRPQGLEPPPLPAYDPAGGYLRQLGVQMFVRITDPTQNIIRNVTVETNVVEISHNALRNLGVQYGTATTLTENVTVDGTNGGRVVNRTIDPAFNQGSILGGNGFGGFGGFGQVNPFRARLDALFSNGDARILSRPNVSALEGMVAQITIGGERPVPSATATFGSNAQSVEFRRFGVIVTMRPTVTDDNTIILQIRADVTQPDPTYQINLNGAIIPGETVRSVDTTLTVRPGDIVVMGGLMNNEKRQQTSRVPVLGDLPIIGSLFRSRRFENNETELAIFMTPRIDAIPATETGLSYVERAPAFPALPGRQESNQIFQNNSRLPGQ